MRKFQGTMNITNQEIDNMKTVDMRVGLTTIIKDLEVKDDSLEIMTIDHDNQLNSLHAIKKDTGMRTVHIKTEPT